MTHQREAGSSIITLLFTYCDHLTFSNTATAPQTQDGSQTQKLWPFLIWQELSLIAKLSDLSMKIDINRNTSKMAPLSFTLLVVAEPPIDHNSTSGRGHFHFLHLINVQNIFNSSCSIYWKMSIIFLHNAPAHDLHMTNFSYSVWNWNVNYCTPLISICKPQETASSPLFDNEWRCLHRGSHCG